MKAAFSGAQLVDFTGKHKGFKHMKQFGQEFIDLVRNCKDGSRAVVILDTAIGGRYTSPLVVKDHINLSGDNPLTGPNHPLGQRFPIVQGIYFTDCLKGANTGVAAGLCPGVKPTGEEQQALKEIGVDICSYNLVPSMLVAAHAGWKVLGVLIPEGATLSDEHLQEIQQLTEKKKHTPKSVDEAVKYLQQVSKEVPAAAIILGSGVNVLENLDDEKSIPYEDVFGISPGVAGHSGTISLGRCAGKLVAVLRGRFHCYEGHPWDVVTLPAQTLIRWGVKQLYVTNAAGGINQNFNVGDLMLITGYRDWLNSSYRKTGLLSQISREAVSCNNAFTDQLVQISSRLHREDSNFRLLQAGVYVGLLGPNYETMAEIELYKTLKCDAVGMSTVPELITCHGTKTQAAAISVVTNVWKPDEAVGGHEEVLAAAKQASERLDKLFRATLALHDTAAVGRN